MHRTTSVMHGRSRAIAIYAWALDNLRRTMGLALVAPMPQAGLQGGAGGPVAAHADMRLQVSRRVDWRFLLPDPILGRVAYLGPTRGALLDSLRMFSAALTVIEAAALHDNLSAQFELVVVKAPIGAKMKQAAELVGPGGYLYVEVLRRWGRSPADYISAIRQLRFVEVEAYWHWPNFGACTEIVPLGDPVAITHALGQHRSGGAERLKSALGRALVRMGLLARLVPCFSLVARKQARSESK